MNIRKERYEKQVRGMSDVAGSELHLEWGQWPSTNGEGVIWLPISGDEPWDTHEMLQSGLDHEIAHNMFGSDVEAMQQWVESWTQPTDKHDCNDPTGFLQEELTAIIQTVEDERIQHQFGEIFPGAKRRFNDTNHPNLHLDEIQTPADVVHGLHVGQVADVYDSFNDDIIDPVHHALERAKDGTMQTTVYACEELVQEVWPWYRRRLRDMDVNDDERQQRREENEERQDELENEKEDLKEELEELEQDKNESAVNNEWDEVEELEEDMEEVQEDIEDVEQEMKQLEQEMEQLDEEEERSEELAEDVREELSELSDDMDRDQYGPETFTGDCDLDDEVLDGDIEDIDEELQKQYRDQEQRRQEIQEALQDDGTDDEAIEDTMEGDIRTETPTSDPDGRLYGKVVSDLTREFKSIVGESQTFYGIVGEDIDISRFIDGEASPQPRLDVFEREILTTGFHTTVLLDLSGSMIGRPLETCRNIGATLDEVFSTLDSMGLDVDFDVIGYSGGNAGKIRIVETDGQDDILSMDTKSSYSSTPTWKGVEYVRKKMERSGSTDRFLILITDGCPSMAGVDNANALTYTKRELDEARDSGIIPFTIGIDVPYDEDEMQRCYGVHTNVDEADEAADILTQFIREQLVKRMRT